MSVETRLTPKLIAGYNEGGYWSDVTVGERLDRIIAASPNKTAVIDATRQVTYEEFGRLVDGLALGLHGLGMDKGDRITAQLPNRVEALAVYFAAAKIGAVLCPVVPYYRAAEVRYILERSESVALLLPDSFGGFDYLQMLDEIRSHAPAVRDVIVLGEEVPRGMLSFHKLVDEGWAASSGAGAAARLAGLRPLANDPLALMFTSGTEAAPKAPILTHNTIHNVRLYNPGLELTEHDIQLCLAPVYHALGLAVGAHLVLAEVGATCVWMDSFEPGQALRLIERTRVTSV